MSSTELTETTQAVPVHEVAGSGAAPVWEEDMPARPVRAKLGRLTMALIVLAVAAAAYYLGVATEKHSLPASAATTAASAAARPAAAGATGAGGGGATIGQVKLIDGTNIYVTDQTGNVVKVATSAASQITVTSTGSVKDIKPGDTVLVTGPTGDDGTVSATAVRDQGTGGGGFGGRARGGSGAGGTSGAGGAAPAGG